MSTQTNKAIVRRLLEQVWNERRFDLIEEFFTEDVVHHVAGQPTTTGLESIKATTAMALNAFPDIQVTIDDEIAEGDKVVFRVTSSGTHQGELLGIPATGKRFMRSALAVYRLANAKIAEAWFVADNLSFMQQLGVIPTPESA